MRERNQREATKKGLEKRCAVFIFTGSKGSYAI